MKHILLVLLGILVMHLITGCGDGNAPVDDNATNEPTNQNADLNTDTSTALVNGFCAAQTQLQIVSTGLLSAYSVKGNGSDLNYCGGEIILTEDNPDFAISINDYCFNFRNQQLTLNGDIIGAIESGANFTSQIQALSVVGDAVDLSISGRTWDGRADDMFISITVHDNLADVSAQAIVGDTRMIGVVGALELVKDKETGAPFEPEERIGLQVYELGLKRNLLLRPLGNVIYFFLPLCVTPRELTDIFSRASEVMRMIEDRIMARF